MFSINAQIRDNKITREELKKNGLIPAVFYGSKEKSTPISVSLIDFKKLWSKAGMSATIKLIVDKKELDVLINDIQIYPLNNEPIHVDFLVVDANKPVTISVPIEFIGVAPAVKNGLGVLVKVLRELEIEALPKNLPQILSVDVSTLVDLDSQISAQEVKLPEGVLLVTEPEEVVVSVASQEEETENTSEPIDLSKIEVEKKGKKEEESSEA